ncbi:hypothetical protein [Mesorhizobium sophorae]|uniref:hypothetical protein n=1 Tax=Mesorhizobium sophorae TaxID=1300294 RepID=UPI00117D2C6E|nr:hypothetical protein [Mesorhizobium sophorae]
MGTEAASFINRLRKDKDFRHRFVQSPKDVLSEEGLNPDVLALPDRINERDLLKKLEHVFSGREWQDEFARAKPETLTAGELWERFGVIGWKGSAAGGGKSGIDVSVASAVVIYGVSVVTSSSTQVAAAGSLAMTSVEQLRSLRELARVPKEKLSFSIVGPDGVAIEGVNADMLAAFLARVK